MLARPVTAIFNLITKTSTWPACWKVEYVTVIPKVKDPQQPSDCRNISCTNYLSKLYESFVLDWSREQVKPKQNQYGGEKGASATQLLIEVLYDITSALEDNRAAVVLSAIDFSKAFNRLDHQKCLQAFADKGASTQILNLLASFLGGRTMTVKVEQERSAPRAVNAGAPQGSVLGCYLFNIAIDELETGLSLSGQEQEEAHEETMTRTDDFPAASTPQRVRPTDTLNESPISTRRPSFDILPRVANVPPWIRRPKDPRYHEGSLNSYKYVDDNINTSKVNMKKAKLLVEDNKFFKEVVDTRTQELLSHVANKAEELGMAINAEKTGLMLVSAATSFEARTRLNLGGQTVLGKESLKVLGVTLEGDLSFQEHVDKIAAKTRSKSWALAKLKRKGLSEEKLLRAYKCLVRPSLEYAAPAWHSLLNATQAAHLERQQTQCLKNIFGTGLSAAKLRKKAHLGTLFSRREEIVVKFAKKSLVNPRISHWFSERPRPVYSRRPGVNYPKFREETVRTDRHRNTPRNYLIRKVNETV